MERIIGWWSGGVTSAVAIYLMIEKYGVDKVEVYFIDTRNEHKDTYRFLKDCEKLYGREIVTLRNDNYGCIQDVWKKYLSLNVANGAVCSSELKRRVREKWQQDNPDYDAQIFGFDPSEPNRAKSLSLNHPKTKPIFPLLERNMSKEECITFLEVRGIKVPEMYYLGFNNNNCFGADEESLGGCVQGGIGYWQKIQREYPKKFEAMAKMEHELTDLKGKPVTMLRKLVPYVDEQGNKKRKGISMFLISHPKYPDLPQFSEQKGKEPKPLMECNGMCGINDFGGGNSETYHELSINLDDE